MSRLIDADVLMETIRTHDYPLRDYFNSTGRGMYTVGIQQAVDEQQTIDAVEVVRCKDCRYGKEACGNIECTVDIGSTWAEYHGYEWFCPLGERR